MATTVPNLTQTTKPLLSKPGRAWELIALLAVVGALILGELAFQWGKRSGWTTYTAADGLADNGVASIAVAPDGALWFGPWDGDVSHFDGQTWATADGLAGSSVLCITVVPDGALWVGTYHGVSRFDGGIWTTFAEDDGLAGKWVKSIAVAPDGALWVGTTEGVFHFNGGTWITFTEDGGPADNDVNSIAVAPAGALWLSIHGQGISRFDAETWTTYTEDDGLASNHVCSVAVAPDGALWVGTGAGVSRFDGGAWTTYTAADGLAADSVRSIAVAPDGTVWIVTWAGVSRFDGGTWTTSTTADGLADNDIRFVVVAPDGTTWVCTSRDDGISHFDGETWTTYTTASSGLAKGYVDFLAADGQGRVWVGTHGGLQVFDEHMSPVQVLQTWIVLRMLGIVGSVLLAIVWIVRLVRRKLESRLQAMPAERSAQVDQVEKRTARNWYWWLWLSPLITLPSFIFLFLFLFFVGEILMVFSLSQKAFPIEVLGSALWHLVLLIPASNRKSEFVRWHGRQALLLAGVQTTLPLVFGLVVPDWYEGLPWFMPVLITVWFFGTLWGQRQAARGDCSLMRWFGRAEALPAPEAVAEPAQAVKPEPAVEPYLEALVDIIRYSRDPEERRQALAELEKRGMVDSL